MSAAPYASFNEIIALGGAVLLMAAGIVLTIQGARTRRDARARRIGLVMPGFGAGREARLSDLDGHHALIRAQVTSEDREVLRRLAALGLKPQRALAIYRAARLVLALAAGVVGLVAARGFLPEEAGVQLPLFIGAGAAMALWFVPSIVVKRLAKARAKLVAAGLPDALELLVVCVEAGLSLEDGIDRAVIELRRSQPALAEELALTAADLKILPSRDQALAHLAERLAVPSVRSLVTTLSQTLRYGTPLAQAMRTVAAELRNDALLRIEERANELPVMLTVPLMLFIMPTIFLVVGGPAALRIIDIFLH
jgi:tight adherence protein C